MSEDQTSRALGRHPQPRFPYRGDPAICSTARLRPPAVTRRMPAARRRRQVGSSFCTVNVVPASFRGRPLNSIPPAWRVTCVGRGGERGGEASGERLTGGTMVRAGSALASGRGAPRGWCGRGGGVGDTGGGFPRLSRVARGAEGGFRPRPGVHRAVLVAGAPAESLWLAVDRVRIRLRRLHHPVVE